MTSEKTMTRAVSTAAFVLALLVSGCASQKTQTEATFGDAVRSTVKNQVYNVETLSFPSEEAVTGGNQDRLENVITTHGSESSQQEGSVQQPIVIGVGGGSGR